MDSVTQLALGAAVGQAVLGRRIGNRAALWGGICGTLPDMDNFIPFGDPVASFTWHRSFSHSLFVLALITPIIAWLIRKIHPDNGADYHRWCLLVYLVFATHVFLDAFTVYGTQFLWPFTDHPFSGSTIFIIDPAYTFPLLAGVGVSMFLSPARPSGYYLNTAGLLLSSLYLAWTVGAKFHVDEVAAATLQKRGISYRSVLSTPTPFNSILWRFVVMDNSGYFEGFYSVLDSSDDFSLERYNSDGSLLNGICDHWPVRRLQWFTHGFYSVSLEGRDIIMTDLRMGLEPDYAFRFKVAEAGNPHPEPVPARRVEGRWDPQHLQWLWQRILHPR